MFVNCFLLFEALVEDWRVVKWVTSWNKVFIIINMIISIVIEFIAYPSDRTLDLV